MQKQKKYDWKDTNMAEFGSDIEKKCKAAAAATEPQWVDVGKRPELRIWRIEQFKVVKWPNSSFGKFYEGDSYILCKTYLDEKKLKSDIHFWIGKYSSPDEYGTAAYKTVELDDLLGGAATQHREVMGNESALFKGYFPRGLFHLKGGTHSGFNEVETNTVEINPKLLWIKGTLNSLVLKEVKMTRSKMNSGDVFMLDIGPKVWLWVGSSANMHEKRKGQELLHNIKAERGGRCESFTLEEQEDANDETHPEFCHYLPHAKKGLLYNSTIKLQDSAEAGDDEDVVNEVFIPILYQVKTGGKMEKLASAKELHGKMSKIPRSVMTYDDSWVVLLDTGFHVFVRIGSKADGDSKIHAMSYAHSYLSQHKHSYLPVTRMTSSSESAEFQSFFTGSTVAHVAGGDSAGGCGCIIM